MDDHKLKSKWESSNNFNLMFDQNKDYNYGYDGMSWRQRNFMCNFCKKEYKSAQALGGHMNVHRRDRARLRLSSPSHLLTADQPNPNPNPNPNVFSSDPQSSSQYSSSLLCLPANYKTTFHSSLFPLSANSPSALTCINIHQDQQQQEIMFVPHSSSARNDLHVMRNLNGNSCVDQEKDRVWKMEMDLLKDGKIDMGLDLELRLGRP